MGEGFASALSGQDEVQIEFAKADGRRRKIPVWFAVEGGDLELLPMLGTKTKWFGDVERNGMLVLSARGQSMAAAPKVLRERDAVERVKRHFAAKYGEDDVKRYYPTSEVALAIKL